MKGLKVNVTSPSLGGGVEGKCHITLGGGGWKVNVTFIKERGG